MKVQQWYPVMLLGLLITSTLNAQFYDDKVRMKFGKVEMEELKMSSYPKDTGAVALVLADYGNTYFSFSITKSFFEVIYERHCRIKVLKNSGYAYANVEIPTRASGTMNEAVINLKASTYNLVDGKMVEYKLSRKNIFEEKTSEDWKITKFSLPNVEVGSVIEFSYRINSDYYDRIRSWQFQKNIPVAWSEYTIKVPQYYKFLQFSQGYERFYKQEKKLESGSLTLNTSSGAPHTEMYQTEVNYFAVKDAPGLASEKFITTQNDFYTKVEFQIATIQMPYSHIVNVLADWPELEKKLLEYEKFGGQINKSGFMKTELQALVKDCPDNKCKMEKVYDFVRQNIEWNEIKSYLCESNVRKAFSDKVGNSAEINLMLVSALREIGFQADPVILSTRDNGRIHPVYPIISKFNYVIAMVKTDGKNVLFDATDRFIVPGQLPARCLNFQGRLISETMGSWINLSNLGDRSSMFSANLTIEEDGTMVGQLEISSTGYDAADKRKEILINQDDYVKKLKDEKKSWDIKSCGFENLEKLSEKLMSKLEVRISDAVQQAGNVIFIQPMLTEGLKENPFKQESRIFPIDFTCRYNEVYYIKINVPEGYAVEELPKNAVWALPDNGGTFSYSILNLENSISVTANYSIKKALFTPDAYPALKEFHNLIVAKCAEQIVLKKKT